MITRCCRAQGIEPRLRAGSKDRTGRAVCSTTQGAPIIDALIEIWQANAAGRYAHPGRHAQRCAARSRLSSASAAAPRTRSGAFRFRTIRPGRVPGPGNTLQAPHIALGMIGPGIPQAPDDAGLFSPTRRKTRRIRSLALVPEQRRATLIASPERGRAKSLPLRHSPGRPARNRLLRLSERSSRRSFSMEVTRTLARYVVNSQASGHPGRRSSAKRCARW